MNWSSWFRRTRDGEFQTELFERYERSEKALVLAMLEMYVGGVSTRKVSAITEALCGLEVSKSQVSALTAKLDAEIAAWRLRSLTGAYPYLVVDARYERVRQGGAVVSQGVLWYAASTSAGTARRWARGWRSRSSRQAGAPIASATLTRALGRKARDGLIIQDNNPFTLRSKLRNLRMGNKKGPRRTMFSELPIYEIVPAHRKRRSVCLSQSKKSRHML